MRLPEDRPTDLPFLCLASMFVAALVVCNLIAQKFVTVDLGFKVFVVSAGSLPYPVTFLVTDLLSELYGKRRTNQIVFTGFLASIFVLGVLWLGARFPAIDGTIVDDATYLTVFQNSWKVILSSMIAYLTAQFMDVRLFHFWRELTKGRHLWLRNNASTITSQLVDSTLVVLVLFTGNPEWPLERMLTTIRDLWLFKVLIALLDTPVIYAIVLGFERWERSRLGP